MARIAVSQRSFLWPFMACFVACAGNGRVDGTQNADSAPTSSASPELEPTTDLIEDGEQASPSETPSECARDSYEGQRSRVNLYLVLDISGSMEVTVAVDSEVTQWDAVRTAVIGFIEADESRGLGLALNYYPRLGARADCDDLNRCEANVPCVTRLCDLSYAVFGEAWPCSLDLDCGVRLNVGGQTLVERCGQPGRCSNSPFQMCFFDPECGEGAVCEPADRGLCPGEMSCDASGYEEPAVPLTVLPEAAAPLIDSLLAHEPDMFGRTPTQVALAGAYARVAEWQSDDPAARSVVVLATDGAPLGCNGVIARDQDVALALDQTFDELEAANGRGIDTYVIGVVPSLSGLSPEDQATLQPGIEDLVAQLGRMAELGGTAASFNVTADDTTTGAFLDALSVIRGEVLPCDYQIPEPANGTVSFTQLNVELSDSSGTRIIPKVGTSADCVNEDGWHFDVETSTETPTRIVLCPATCGVAEQATTERVDIVLGCTTVEKAR
jgi:Mg-chelatase subunit ChlD